MSAAHRPGPGRPIPPQPIDADQSLGELVQPHDERRRQARQHPDRAGQGGDQGGGRPGPARASGWSAAGASRRYFALLLLSFAVAYWIADAIDNLGAGFLIVGLVYAAVAAVLVLKGKQQITSATPIAEQTIEAIKEDVEWARQQRT